MFVVIGIFLSIGKLDVPGAVSVTPALTIASLAVLVFTLKIRPTSRTTTALIWFVAYTTIHGLLLSLTDVASDDFGTDRFLSYVRQMVALIGGLSVFFFIRQLVTDSRPSKFAFWLLIGGIPAVVLSAMQPTGTYSPGGIFTTITVFVRSHIIGMDPNMPRITGLSPEPSVLSGYIAVIAIPLAVGLIFAKRRPLQITGILGALTSVILILATYSGVGYFLLAIVATASIIVIPRKWRWHAVLVLGLIPIAGYAALAYTPGNYLLGVIRETETFTYIQSIETPTPTVTPTPMSTEQPTSAPTAQPTPVSRQWVRDLSTPLGISDPFLLFRSALGEKTGTVGSKLYSTTGPISNLTSLRGIIGYGLGGSSYHATEFLSPLALDSFPGTGLGRRVTLKSLLGKIVSETGLIGTLLFGWVIAAALTELRKILRLKGDRPESILARAAILSLLTLTLGSITAFGSLAIPYLWMALGITTALLARSSLPEQTEDR